MSDSFDVMSHKDRWDSTTRKVVEERVSTVPTQSLFDSEELKKIEKVADALLPGAQESVPMKEILGREFEGSYKKGVRLVDLPWRPEMYKKGLQSLDEEAKERFSKGLAELSVDQVTDLLVIISQGGAKKDFWEFPPDLFFRTMVEDIVAIYYSFPQSWSEIEFAGPAYPYGYYRLGCEERMEYEPDVEGKNHE